MSGRASQRGFTSVELMITATILVPILAVIATSVSVLSRNMAIDDAKADATESLRTAVQRVVETLRPAVRSTFEVRADQDDIDWHNFHLLTPPALGDWIEVRDLVPRQEMRFRSADGRMSMNAAVLTDYRRMFFVRDAGETVNGVDDDGDGHVDEGRLDFEYDGRVVTLARDIESCELTLDGKLITIDLTSARSDGKGWVHRATVRQSFYMRNK